MKLANTITNKYYKRVLLLIVSMIILGLVLKFGIGWASVKAGMHSILLPYLKAAGSISNLLIGLINDGVTFVDLKFQFNHFEAYYEKNQEIIQNWEDYLLFLKWTAFIGICIWIPESRLTNKIAYTIALGFVHFLSVISGMVLIGGIAPILTDPSSLSELRPHTIGSLFMFSFLVFWYKKNKKSVYHLLNKFGINAKPGHKKENEVILVFLAILLIRNFFVPYFNYYGYISFLFHITQKVVGIFGYNSYISGPYLIGDIGTLYMAKWCLGFLTMFVFLSMVFLTRRKTTITLIYITTGIIILHIANIFRLSALFIYAQQHRSYEAIENHHTIFNIIVYVLILLLWFLWFEFFAGIRVKKITGEIKNTDQ